jgi:hypothetical protein
MVFVSQWTFMKPKPQRDIENYIKMIFETNCDVCYVAFTISVDDTGSRYLQGFVKTVNPCNMETLMTFGPGIYTPCLESKSPILTEILMDLEVHEFGKLKARNLEKHKREIMLFKKETGYAMKAVLETIKRKHFKFFQANPHLVDCYLKSPEAEGDYPKSFKEDADSAMFHAIAFIGEKYPELMQNHPRPVLQCLVRV